jgi:REP element-mobilizing transposase RayT
MPIFLDDDDRAIFLALLGLVVLRFDWDVKAYCLMGNHFHIVVQTPGANLSEGMQMLNGRYAMLFNAKYGYGGHLFEGRFKCRVVTDDDDLPGLLTYVEENPVRHGICTRAIAWPWSSARRRCAPAAFARVDLTTFIAYHAGTIDEASDRFARIVRGRWGDFRRRAGGARGP